MGKLVRDRIPEIIEANGENPHTKVLSGIDFIDALKEKLVEEAGEVRSATERKEVLEECADVYEVLLAFAKTYDFTMDDIVTSATQKSVSRGSFNKCIFLEKVE